MSLRGEPIPRLRWHIGGLLGVGVLINYFDRISLSVGGPQLERVFALTPAELGLLFSAFFWSYALLQIPASLLLDRWGVTRIGRWSALLWSMASTVTACASGLVGLLIGRLLLGCAEAPSFPANAKATGYWFPRSERSTATALFDSAAKLSNVLGVPLVAFAVVRWGWRWGFGLVAALSLVYFIAFYRIYRDPSRHERLGREERGRLATGGAAPEQTMPPGMAGAARMLIYLLGRRKVWGLSIGFAAYGYCFYLFLTWLPDYFITRMHMGLLKSAAFTAIPWGCATVSDLLVGGWLIDRLIRAGRDETRVRKTVFLAGMCGGLAVLGITTTRDPVVATAWLSVALTGLAAAAPVGWSLPSLIAPPAAVGTVGGIMNFANNLMGAAAPVVTGYIIERTHSFAGAFGVAGIVLLAGMVAFVLLLGRIEPIPGPAAAQGGAG